MAKEPLVRGMLVIPAGAPCFENGTAYISIEDISYADALSETVAGIIIPGISHAGNGAETMVPFAIYPMLGGQEIDPRADYAVDAWVNCTSDGRMGKGDLANDEIHRVLTQGFDATVTIFLKQLR